MTMQAQQIGVGTRFIQDGYKWVCLERLKYSEDEVKIVARQMYHAGYIVTEFVYKFDQAVYIDLDR